MDIRAGRLLCRRRKLLGRPSGASSRRLASPSSSCREHEAGASPITASQLHEIARRLGVTVGLFFENAAGTDGDPPNIDGINEGLTHLPSAD